MKVGVVMDKHEQAFTEDANAATKDGSATFSCSAGDGDRSSCKTGAAVLLLATALSYDVTVVVETGTGVTVLIDIRGSGTI